MRVRSSVKINMPRLKQLTQAQVTALEMTAEAVHTDIVQGQVVPRDKGTLQGESFFADYDQARSGTVALIHSQPYARKLYFHPEYHFSKAENPHASGKWFVDWMSGGRKADFALEAYKKIYRRLTGV